MTDKIKITLKPNINLTKLNKKYKCIYPNCNIQPSYGKIGSKIKEYCKQHIPDDTYVDITHKKCIFPNCNTLPSYGKIGSKIKEYCKQHIPNDTYVDIVNKKCMYSNCNTRPSYGKIGSKITEYCKEHIPDDTYIDIVSKQCIYPNCTTRPSYGKIGSNKEEYCKQHIPDDTYVDIKHKKCIYPNCTTRPSYGKIGSKIKEYCKQHIPDNTYVDIVSKQCIYPNCSTIPVYGKIGSNKREYCKIHIPDNTYIDIVSKQCIYPNCNTRPSYGKIGSNKKEYCKQHIPDDTYVDIANKQCLYPNCTTQPTYGKIGSNKKEYCKQHIPDDTYVDIANKQCLYSNCNTRPSYGYIGYSPTYCSSHKEKGMISNSLVKCCLCTSSKKKLATKTKDKKYYCDKHSEKDSIDIHNICTICCISIVDIDEFICKECDLSCADGKTIKRKLKELSVKQKIEDSNINISLYDKVIPEGCSKKRPDFVINTNWGSIIIEVDEFQHNRKSYSCECEITRMKQIYFDIGIEQGKILFIRYNPDVYKPSYGDTFTTNEKLNSLIRTVNYYLNNEINNYLEVLYLFYDGYTQLTPEIDIINPYEK